MIQPHINHDLPATPEVKTQQEIFTGLLTGIANHEAKLATTAIIATQPDRWFSETELWNEVCARQGDSPSWVPERRGPASYCRNSLGPIGLVAKGLIAGTRGQVAAFKANDAQPEAVNKGLAISGTLLEWSLRYSDISLQKIFGATAAKGAFRTPEVRYGILKELVDNIGSPLTYTDIAEPLLCKAVDERNVYASIRELTDNETIKTQVIDVADDIVLEITGPYQYCGRGLHLNQMSEAGQLTYKAIDRLWDRGVKEVSFREFTAAALEINSQADLSKLRQFWYYGSKTEYENMPNFKPVTRKMHGPSIVALNPIHSDALQDLVRRLREIEDPTADLTSQMQRAKAIIANPDDMSALYGKARKFSSSFAGQEESSEIMSGRIISIVVDAGQITTNGVFEALRKSNRRMTEDSIRTYLTRLAKTGELVQEKRKLDPSKKREYLFYSLPQKDKLDKTQ